eukprot:TRINITY_DN13875_c0_g1_i5.p1 TRINITY_DN13875_c0_g1~~TRINITY_DN13875_c0_g1_i5.p1  ORF type:complete len:174 (+),score=32.20 TRINITY_DN13875_c0_g1_i5:75-596(+)
MLLLGTFVGFLILLDITTVSHADPKDIHIYLHGLRKSANKPRVEAGIAETNTEATGESGESGGEEESNRGFGENGCSPEWNRNSYKLIGQLITHQSPCYGNSLKFQSPSGIMQPFEPIPGPTRDCSPPCTGNSPISLPWPKILPNFTPPPPPATRIVRMPYPLSFKIPVPDYQ